MSHRRAPRPPTPPSRAPVPSPHATRRAHPPQIDINVAWLIRRNWRAVPLLARVASHVAHAEHFARGQLAITVVGATRMARLHQQTLAIAGPTDVLTFDLGTDPAAGWLDGEIIVCAAAALRNARPRGSLAGARAELALYVAHGVLHLAGYDDHTAAGFERMHKREDRLLTQLGLGPVFSR